MNAVFAVATGELGGDAKFLAKLAEASGWADLVERVLGKVGLPAKSPILTAVDLARWDCRGILLEYLRRAFSVAPEEARAIFRMGMDWNARANGDPSNHPPPGSLQAWSDICELAAQRNRRAIVSLIEAKLCEALDGEDSELFARFCAVAQKIGFGEAGDFANPEDFLCRFVRFPAMFAQLFPMFSLSDFQASKLLRCIIEVGHAETLDVFLARGQLPGKWLTFDFLRSATERGNPAMLRRAVEKLNIDSANLARPDTRNISPREAFREALSRNHFAMASWIIKTFGLKREEFDKMAIRSSFSDAARAWAEEAFAQPPV